MNYSETLKFIHSLERFGIKPGLERMEAFGGTGEADNFFHVAGTNGKGSICHMLASALEAAEYKVGLFTSPYVIDFRERIQVNGEYIAEEKLAEYVSDFAPRAQENGSTEFEFITVLAFKHFSPECAQTHYNIIETGLGGRFDATNVIKNPLCSAVTNIALDHTAILGGTIEEIAFEKAGIIKEGCPVVIAPQRYKEATKVLLRVAEEKNAPVFLCDMSEVEIIKCDLAGSVFVFEGNEYELSMIGEHQIANAITAIRALEASGVTISYDQIAQGLRTARVPARLEVLCDEPLVILDGAHNPDGARALYEALKPMKGQFTAILGVMEDKDCEQLLEIIAPLCERSIVCTVEENPRSILAENLKKIAKKHMKKVEIAKDYDEALAKCKKAENVLICGSLYLAGGIRQKASKYFNKC